MNTDLQLLTGTIVALTALFISALAIWFLQKHPQELNFASSVTILNDKVRNLQITIDSLLEDRNRDREQINLLQRRIQALEVQLAIVTGKPLEEIRNLDLPLKTKVPVLPKALPVKPLLLIGGADEDLFNRDRQALRKARVKFQRLTQATRNDITKELSRRRLDSTLYLWVVISAHAGPEGILLTDGIAPPDFWSEQLEGIQLVLLASCSSATTADQLAGMVDMIIYFMEDVGRQDASDFMYALVRQLIDGTPPQLAYQKALEEVPQVSEFVDLRTG